mgnify:CR=1 FL=1|jgi:hypothetical protein
MAYDYSELKRKIAKKFGTQKKFAKAIGLSERTVSLKLNNKIYFAQDEISKAAELLEIEDEEIREYFFIVKVQ